MPVVILSVSGFWKLLGILENAIKTINVFVFVWIFSCGKKAGKEDIVEGESHRREWVVFYGNIGEKWTVFYLTQ